MVIIWKSFPLFVKVKRIDYFPWKFRGQWKLLNLLRVAWTWKPSFKIYTTSTYTIYKQAQEHISNFGSAYFSFSEHAPENKIFLSISEKNFHFRSRLCKFGSMNLPIYLSICLSIYLSACLPVCLSNYLEIKWFCR